MKIRKYLIILMGIGCLDFNLMASEAMKTDPEDRSHIPVAIKKVLPHYPVEMAKAGIEGFVVIEGLVDTHGDYVALSIVEASNEDFGKSAIKALKKWKFDPARQNGEPVMRIARIPVRYTLEYGASPVYGELIPVEDNASILETIR